MGLLSGLFDAVKIETAKNGLLAKHFFHFVCSPEQRDDIVYLANQQFESDNIRMGMRHTRLVNDLSDRVKYLFYAHLMNSLNVNPLYPKFFWKYTANPFQAELYDDKIYRISSDIIRKDYDITVRE
jgi:hypothetical protein